MMIPVHRLGSVFALPGFCIGTVLAEAGGMAPGAVAGSRKGALASTGRLLRST